MDSVALSITADKAQVTVGWALPTPPRPIDLAMHTENNPQFKQKITQDSKELIKLLALVTFEC